VPPWRVAGQLYYVSVVCSYGALENGRPATEASSLGHTWAENSEHMHGVVTPQEHTADIRTPQLSLLTKVRQPFGNGGPQSTSDFITRAA
jgi:hypothetical protein